VRGHDARLAVAAIVTAQTVTVAVMTVTPVHIALEGRSIDVVGITIGLHIVPLIAMLAVRAVR